MLLVGVIFYLSSSPAFDRAAAMSHPRVRLLDSAVPGIRRAIASNQDAAQLFTSLKAHGDTLLTAPLVNCTKSGPEVSLLMQARSVLDRTYTLGLLHRINGQNASAYGERAVAEMLHVSGPACPDWNPPHFLDTAEMSHAVAIGYDWLYPTLNSSVRTLIEEGVAEKGLRAGAVAYAKNFPELTTVYNWDLVCNGGLLAAAVAFAEINGESSDLARGVFLNATTKIRPGFSSYAPDGGWPEGTTYWGYGTKYALLASELLRAVNGSDDGGLSNSPGFLQTGIFRILSAGPTGATFNWFAPTPLYFLRPEVWSIFVSILLRS